MVYGRVERIKIKGEIEEEEERRGERWKEKDREGRELAKDKAREGGVEEC